MTSRQYEILQLAHAVLIWASLFSLLHVLLIVCRVPHRLKVKEGHHEWTNYVLASLHAVISGAAGLRGLLLEAPFSDAVSKVIVFASPVDTVHGSSSTLQAFMPVMLGYFLYDLCLPLFPATKVIVPPLIVMHHLICVAVWPLSYYHEAGCFYLLYFMACELSTPFLWLVVYFMPKHGLDGLLRSVLGVLMALVFFLVRVLPAPWLLSSLVASQSFWKDTDTSIYVLAMITLPLPSLLFTYWFAKIMLGFLEALGLLEAHSGVQKES